MGRKLNLDLIPTCLGTHEPEENACDGDPEGAANDSIPCSWRERCIGFKRHLEDTGHDDEQYIELVPIKSKIVQERTGWKRTAEPVNRSHADFNKFCGGLVRLYGVQKLPRALAQAEPQAPSRSSSRTKKRRPAHGNKYSTDKARQAAVRKIVALFCFTLREVSGRKLSVNRIGGSLVLGGGLYVIDRREKSGYLSIYCRKNRREYGAESADIGVASLHPRYRTKTVDIRLAADVRAVQKVLATEDQFSLNPVPVVDGAFKSVCKRLDVEKATTLAHALARLIEQGIINLPPR